MENKKIFVIGDLILDEYIEGNEYRISDEAPVPIVKVDGFIAKLGGAANVANNLKHLGLDVLLCGVIGETSVGYSASRFIKSMKENGLSTFYIIEGDVKTTTKSRVIIKGQQVVRFDYEDNRITDVIHKEIMEKISCFDFRKSEIIVVSDYDKGVITKEIMKSLKEKNVKIIVDPKPKNIALYRDVFAITPNLREFIQICGKQLSINNVEEIKEEAQIARKVLHIDNIIVTLGQEGALCCSENMCNIFTARKVEISNTIGAGDTFISALAYSFCLGNNISESVNIANIASSIVISKKYTGVCTETEINKILNGE